MPNAACRLAPLLSLLLVGSVAACGSGDSEPPKGMLQIRNGMTVPIYDMNTKPAGTDAWENITPWIEPDGGSKLNPNYNINVPVPYGPKDFKYTYFDSNNKAVTKLYPNAFTIGPDKMPVAAVKPGGVDFTYTDPPPPSGGTSGGNCSDNGASCKSDSAVVTWTNRCSAGPSQAPCYCAAAATYDCYLRKGCYKEAGAATQVTRAQLESGRTSEAAKAAALGTTCF